MQPSGSDVRRSTRRLFVWFLLTTIVPAVALVWLGWVLVTQDRREQATARAAARDQAAELAATALQRTLAELEEQVSSFSFDQVGTDEVSEGVAVVTFGRNGLVARVGLPLLFHPVALQPSSALPDVLDAADRLEFSSGDPAAALRVVEPLTDSVDPRTRAEAWLRVARIERKLGRIDRALAAYDALTVLDDEIVDRRPAGLAGLQGRALTLAATGQTEELASAAGHILRSLDDGRWVLMRAPYEFARQQARGWLPPSSSRPSGETEDDERAALSEAASAVWDDWRRGAGSTPQGRGRTTRWVDGRSVLLMTRSTADQLTVMLVGPRFLDAAWRGESGRLEPVGVFDLALTDAEGRTVLGDPHVPFDRQSSRSPAATNLPWTVHVIDDDASPISLSRQAVVMLAAFGLMLGVVGAGGYVITRALSRELRVAQLQSDFVAAVSHEFRTPLTTVRHLSELLVRDRVSTDGRRREFYGILLRESDRLQRLVESLLNFARLESGEVEYRFRPVSPGPFLRDVVLEFRDEAVGRNVDVVLEGDADVLPHISADRDVLARVFWNLLDNAVKYSPAGSEVRVEVAAAGGQIAVKVRDHGAGIPAAEQQQIFQKFVRGTAAKASSIKGTGIGLAMAREIVLAHGGDIRVESQEGQGSTFTVRLPASVEAPLVVLASAAPAAPIAPTGPTAPAGPTAPIGPTGPI